MRSHLLQRGAVLLAAGIFTATGFDAPKPSFGDQAVDIDPGGFLLTFEENFDRLDVSARGPGTRWIAHTPWNGDFGDATFADPKSGFPFTVKDGILRIEARKSTNGKWESGLLASVDTGGAGFTQLEGYFEMRARFPAGEGVWPAFWLVSRGENKSIEIDVVEHYGHSPAQYTASLHVWDRKVPAQGRSFHQRVPVREGALSNDFHTYGVASAPDRIRYFLDRREVWSIATPPELEHPFTILLDLGLGAGWPIENTPNPSVMEVDYVRVFKLPQD
jgi:beta-glucanase (GH16 family)